MTQKNKFLKLDNARAKKYDKCLSIIRSTFWTWVNKLSTPENLNKVDKSLRIILTITKLLNISD